MWGIGMWLLEATVRGRACEQCGGRSEVVKLDSMVGAENSEINTLLLKTFWLYT
jgi:hypothetical protein